MSYDKPLVSVIIPTYNCRALIGQAIDSVLTQTYTNVEIIVVDDGSSDGTQAFLETSYRGKIHYYYQTNGGPGKARNLGLNHASGVYYSFLDADDWLLPEKIALQIAYLEQHPEYGVVYCNFWCAYEDTPDELIPSNLQRFGDGVSGNVFPYLLVKNLVVPHAYFVRKECIEVAGNFEESLWGTEDWDLVTRIAGAGFNFGYIPDRLVVRRMRRGSLSDNSHSMKIYRFRFYAHIKQVTEPALLQEALREGNYAATFEFGVARAFFEAKMYKRGCSQLIYSLKAPHPNQLIYITYRLLYLVCVLILGFNRLEKLLTLLVEPYEKKKSSYI